MNVNIRRKDSNIDYLILDCSNDENLNKLNGIPDSSSLFFYNSETGQTTKIPNQKINELYTENFEKLKSLIEDIIKRNGEITETNLLNKIRDSIFLGFDNVIKQYNFLTLKGTLNSFSDLPSDASIGDIYEINIDHSLCIFSSSKSWIIVNSSNLNTINSNFYTKNDIDNISKDLKKSFSSDMKNLNNLVNNTINNINETSNNLIKKSDVELLIKEYEEKEQLYLNKIYELNEKVNLLLNKVKN